MKRHEYENRRAYRRLEMKFVQLQGELDRERRRKLELECLLQDANAAIARMSGYAFRFLLKNRYASNDDKILSFSTTMDRVMLEEMSMEGREFFVQHMAQRLWVEFEKARMQAIPAIEPPVLGAKP